MLCAQEWGAQEWGDFAPAIRPRLLARVAL